MPNSSDKKSDCVSSRSNPATDRNASAGRLAEIAKTLKLSPGYFFDHSIPASDAKMSEDALKAFLDLAESSDLIRAFTAMVDVENRRSLVRLAELLSKKGALEPSLYLVK